MFIEYFIPWLLTNVISLILIGICAKWPRLGSFIWGIIFFLAGVYNGLMTIQQPEAYQIYGETAVPYYKGFIHGSFAENTALFILIIALSQIMISVGLFIKDKLYKIALIGGIVFLIAITPLGIGSAFPATLLMAVSLILLYRNYSKKK